MIKFTKSSYPLIVLGLSITLLSTLGCATYDEKEMMRINQQQAATIESLNDEIRRLNSEMEAMALAQQGKIQSTRAPQSVIK